MYWQYVGDNFKMTLCWNLQNPVVLKLPITVFERFVNNTFVFKGLMFDWNDAATEGFIITYDQLVSSVSVSVSASGCLDPTVSKVGTSGSTTPLDFTFSGRLLNMSGYWLAFFSQVNNGVIKRSQTNVKYPASADWSAIVDLTANEVLNGGWSVTNNASHIFEWDSRNNGSANGRHTFRLFSFSTGGIFSAQLVETKISSKGANVGGTVLLNSTGYPHIFTSEQTGITPTVHKLFLYRALDKSGVSFSSIDLGVTQRRQFYSMVNCGTVSGYDRFCMVYSSGTETSDLRMRMYYSNNMSVSAERLLGTDFSPTIWDIQGSSDATLHVVYKSNTNTTIRYANYTLEMSKTQKQVVSDVNIETQRASVAILKKNSTDDYTFLWMVKPTGGIYQNKTNSGRTFTNSSLLYTLTGVSPGSSIAVQRQCYQECALLFSNNTASSPVWFLNFGAFSNPTLINSYSRSISDALTTDFTVSRLLSLFRSNDNSISMSESLATLSQLFRGTSESLIFTDSVTNIKQIFVSLIESITTTFNVERVQVLFRSISIEVLSLTDDLERRLEISRSLNDNISNIDSLNCILNLTICAKIYSMALSELLILNTEFTATIKLFTEDGASEILILVILFSVTTLFILRRRYKRINQLGNY